MKCHWSGGGSHNRNPFRIHSCSPLPVPFLQQPAPHVAHVIGRCAATSTETHFRFHSCGQHPLHLMWLMSRQCASNTKGRSCSTATHFWFYSCSS